MRYHGGPGRVHGPHGGGARGASRAMGKERVGVTSLKGCQLPAQASPKYQLIFRILLYNTRFLDACFKEPWGQDEAESKYRVL